MTKSQLTDIIDTLHYRLSFIDYQPFVTRLAHDLYDIETTLMDKHADPDEVFKDVELVQRQIEELTR